MKKMKKILALILALTMVFLLCACGSTSSSSASSSAATAAPAASGDASTTAEAGDASGDPAVTLKFSMNTADTSITGMQYHKFADLLAEESGGSITMEIYAAGSLVDDAGALDAVMDGTADLAHGMVAYMDGTIKDMVPLEIPGYYAGDDYLAFSAGVQDILEDICADYGIKFVGCNYQGQAGFVSTDGCVDGPDFLKGKSVRAAGTYISKAVEAWGGAPTTISLGDLTTALERKTVDVAYTGWNIIGGFKLYEMAPYMTFTTITESFACLIMNQDKYDSLTDNQKAAFERAAERWRIETYNVGAEYRDQYKEEMLAAGVEVLELDSTGTKPFTDLTAPLFDEISGQLGEKGTTLLNTLNELNGK